jgi:hypothetical protein
VTSGWSDIFLGVIAFATLLMAVIQVGAMVAASGCSAGAAGDDVDGRRSALIARANAIAEEAS